MTVVSTDGSCLKNPGGRSAWAWVRSDGGRASGFIPEGTNQVAELQAILEALKSHRHVVDLAIESDSAYAINCSSTWLPNWKKNNWKNSAGKPVANRGIIEAIDAELSAREKAPIFIKVKGHASPGTHPMNEEADVLARDTARSGKGVNPA